MSSKTDKMAGPGKNKAQKIAKKRADELLVEQGLTENRSKAKALIMAGEVFSLEQKIMKAGELWPENSPLTIKGGRRYVSRGGIKLEGALKDLQLDPTGLRALDVGASTGGFTDCLLKHGAAEVTAVDVGKNLLDWTLRQDSRITVVEEVNARNLSAEAVGSGFNLAVIDVSFISLTLIIPKVALLMNPGGRILAMVKPQFEVGRENVGKKGVVRDPVLIRQAVDKISALAPSLSPPWQEAGRAPSRLLGPEGNQEVFLLLIEAS